MDEYITLADLRYLAAGGDIEAQAELESIFEGEESA